MSGSTGAAARRIPQDRAARAEREPPPPPTRATVLLVAMNGAIALFMTWVAWRLLRSALDASTAPSPWSVLAIIAFWLGTSALLVIYLWLQVGTRLDIDGVSQRTLRGDVAIPWSHVRFVDHGAYGMLLISDGVRQVAISAIVYSNADELYAWVAERLYEAGSPAAGMV